MRLRKLMSLVLVLTFVLGMMSPAYAADVAATADKAITKTTDILVTKVGTLDTEYKAKIKFSAGGASDTAYVAVYEAGTTTLSAYVGVTGVSGNTYAAAGNEVKYKLTIKDNDGASLLSPGAPAKHSVEVKAGGAVIGKFDVYDNQPKLIAGWKPSNVEAVVYNNSAASSSITAYYALGFKENSLKVDQPKASLTIPVSQGKGSTGAKTGLYAGYDASKLKAIKADDANSKIATAKMNKEKTGFDFTFPTIGSTKVILGIGKVEDNAYVSIPVNVSIPTATAVSYVAYAKKSDVKAGNYSYVKVNDGLTFSVYAGESYEFTPVLYSDQVGGFFAAGKAKTANGAWTSYDPISNLTMKSTGSLKVTASSNDKASLFFFDTVKSASYEVYFNILSDNSKDKSIVSTTVKYNGAAVTGGKQVVTAAPTDKQPVVTVEGKVGSKEDKKLKVVWASANSSRLAIDDKGKLSFAPDWGTNDSVVLTGVVIDTKGLDARPVAERVLKVTIAGS